MKNKKDFTHEEWQASFNRHYAPKEYIYPAKFDKNVKLETSPHYTDKRFDKEQTVFGKEQEGLAYDYSDRLWQWDYKKSQEAYEVANSSGKVKSSAAYYEVYLSHYFGKPIEVVHIIAGINRSNGHSYCVFGYRPEEQST